MQRLTYICGLLFAVSACAGGSASPEVSTIGTGTGTSTGTSGGLGTSFAAQGSSSGGSGTGGPVKLGVTLSGELAFDAGFAGEFYGFLPDGGPDLSNLDCRISDGTDLGQLCSPPKTPDSQGVATTSQRILDIYVTSISGTALSQGAAEVSAPYSADGGVFATIDLTYPCSDGGWDFERALSGQVSYQATAEGMFGQFQAVFPSDVDGGGTLGGTFGAGYCGSLNRY